MRQMIAGLMVVCAASPAVASDWWLITANGPKPSRLVTFLDVDSSKVNGQTRDIWEAVYFETPQKVFSNARMVKTLERYDCTNATSLSRYFVEYREDGSIIDTVNITNTDPTPIIPDSAGDKHLRVACNGDKAILEHGIHLGADANLLNSGFTLLKMVDQQASKK